MSTEELLIELVQKHECLYNIKLKHYHDNVAKNYAWQQIAQAMGWPEKKVRCRWKSLRDKYVQLLRKSRDIKEGSGSQKPWPYFENLRFLSEHIKRKDIAENEAYCYTVQPESESESALSQLYKIEYNIDEGSHNAESNDPPNLILKVDAENVELGSDSGETDGNQTSAKRKREDDFNVENYISLTKRVLELEERREEEKRKHEQEEKQRRLEQEEKESDESWLFLMSLLPRIRCLNKRKRGHVFVKLLNSVIEAENEDD